MLEGYTARGKTTTALTSRGRCAMIDMDNQAWLSVGRFDFLSPLAKMIAQWDDRPPMRSHVMVEMS